MRLQKAKNSTMAHVITPACAELDHDPACITACPTDSIHPTPSEAAYETEPQLYINPESCIDCGVCVSECPAKAISSADDLPADQQGAVDSNAAYYKK